MGEATPKATAKKKACTTLAIYKVGPAEAAKGPATKTVDDAMGKNMATATKARLKALAKQGWTFPLAKYE